jgi:AraC-like DNA-binding protein
MVCVSPLSGLDREAFWSGKKSMKFSYITPSPSLQGTVRDYLIAHFRFDQDTAIPLKPYAAKPEQGITFFVRGRPSMVNPVTDEVHGAPPVSLFGQQVTRFNVHLKPEFLMLRVHFHPGALFRLLNTPLYELGENYFDAELVLGGEVREVAERLAIARSHAEMIALIEEFLMRNVRRAKHDLHRVDRAASRLVTDPLHVSLDWLARHACLSPRQFNRIFTERIGVGPKVFSRLLRFHRAYQFKATHPAVAWPRVALDFGYTDYQHMVRDFKQFTNTTPKVWLEEDRGSPENVLAGSGAA